MLIGIDASRAFDKDKTGTENYSFELIREILKLKESQKHKFRLYVRDGRKVPNLHGEFRTIRNVEVVEIGWRRRTSFN